MSDTLPALRDPSPITTIASDPMVMIAEAMQRGLDVKELVDLKERIDRAAAMKAFSRSMAAAQAEMPRVGKNKENSNTRSRYADMEKVLDLIKPVYQRHGFSVSFSETLPPPRDGWVRLCMRLRHIEGHEELHYRDGPCDNLGAKGNQTAKTVLQGMASATTYLSRYLICGVFNITLSDHDDDGNGGNPEPVAAITPAQLDNLLNLADVAKADMGRFTAFLGVDDLKNLPATQYAEAEAALKAKIAKGVKP